MTWTMVLIVNLALLGLAGAMFYRFKVKVTALLQDAAAKNKELEGILDRYKNDRIYYGAEISKLKEHLEREEREKQALLDRLERG